MTTDEQIEAALAPCATSGAFQDIAPQDIAEPYIVWQRIVSTTNNTLAGATNMQNTRVQIDCWAKSPSARSTMAAAVVVALAAAPFQNVQLTSQNTYEPDTKSFRAMLEFSIWSAS